MHIPVLHLKHSRGAGIAQGKLLEEQIEVLKTQNMLLSDNYEKLQEMYDSQFDFQERG